MKKIIWISFIIIGLDCFLAADEATYIPGAWGTLTPFKSNDLSMQSEKIDIDVYEGFYNFDPDDRVFSTAYYYIEYKCAFHIKNMGKDAAIMLGFPLEYGEFEGMNDRIFGDCKISANGSPVEYQKYIHGINPELQDINYDEVLGFQLHMNEKEEATVEVVYTNTLFENPMIKYILKSARTLSGSIGKADFRVTFHFPTNVTVEDSPGKYLIEKHDTDPYRIVKWNITNLIPADDISIRFEEDKMPSITDRLNLYKNILDRFMKEKSKASFFAFLRIISEPVQDFITKRKGWKDLKLDKAGGDKAIREYYATMLDDRSISDSFAGIIIGDMENHPQRMVNKKLAETVRKRLDKNARKEYEREIERLDNVAAIISKLPITSDRFNILSKAMEVWPVASPAFIDHSILKTGNYYYANLTNLFDNKEYLAKRAAYRKLLTLAHDAILENLFNQDDDNSDEIANFAAMEINRGEFLKYIPATTSAIWGKKVDPEKTRKLAKILAAIHTYNSAIDRGNNLVEMNPKLLYLCYDLYFKNRIILRKAYYALANNSYMNMKFESAINYYRIGMAYGTVSPLFNFAVGLANLWGTMLYWYADDDHDTAYFPNTEYDWETPYRATNAIMNGEKPYWQDLSDPHAPKEADIALLYSPERLLKLNLEKWGQEKADEAPCYYFAYNIACAYSRLENGNKSFQWLTVAIRMNKSLAKLVPKDKDLEFIREIFKAELENLYK